jgi:hypothetical protein
MRASQRVAAPTDGGRGRDRHFRKWLSLVRNPTFRGVSAPENADPLTGPWEAPLRTRTFTPGDWRGGRARVRRERPCVGSAPAHFREERESPGIFVPNRLNRRPRALPRLHARGRDAPKRAPEGGGNGAMRGCGSVESDHVARRDGLIANDGIHRRGDGDRDDHTCSGVELDTPIRPKNACRDIDRHDGRHSMRGRQRTVKIGAKAEPEGPSGRDS